MATNDPTQGSGAAPVTEAESAPLVPGVVRAGEYVVGSLVPQCEEGAADDDCDGNDDDCDGVIDEACGLTGGKLQVVAAWQSDVDIDLYVTEPVGDTLSFQRTTSMSGGRVEHSGRGACGAGDAEPKRLEAVAWDGPAILRGEYRVVAHYWGECQSMAGPVPVRLSISVEGHVISTMTYELGPNEVKLLASFVIE